MTTSSSQNCEKDFFKSALRATRASVLVNIILGLLKIFVSLITGSFSLLADSIHSFSDLLTDGIALYFAWLGKKPPDEKHPLGHSQYESIGGLIIALMITLTGYELAKHGIKNLQTPHLVEKNSWVLLVAALSVVSKEILFQWTRLISQRHGSTLLLNNALHQRSDALSSLGVLLGAFLYNLGFHSADIWTGVLIGVWILYMGLIQVFRQIQQLTLTSPGAEIEKTTLNILENEERLSSFHKLRIHQVGFKIFMDMHLLFPPQTTLIDAHQVCHEVENSIRQKIHREMDITIHLEPALPDTLLEEE